MNSSLGKLCDRIIYAFEEVDAVGRPGVEEVLMETMENIL